MTDQESLSLSLVEQAEVEHHQEGILAVEMLWALEDLWAMAEDLDERITHEDWRD